MKKETKMNAKSYFFTIVLALPALALGRTVGNSDEFIAGIAQIISLILLVFIIIWTIRRLRNAGRSRWWTFALIPPATIILLAYCFFASSSEEHKSKIISFYGITAKGFWRIASIVVISIFLAYISAIYATFLSDGL
jgi:uncharacterized membrane protein YhaH (DUF805 family)